MHIKTSRALLVLLAASAAVLLAACGSSTSTSTGSSASSSMPGMSMGSGSTMHGTTATSGHANAIDRAFVQQMIPHHQMAVQMARTAKTQGQHPQITTLAGTSSLRKIERSAR